MEGIPGEKIAVFHFNDAPAEPAREEQTDADRVYPGDGILDLGQMIAIVKDAGYSGVISLELFNPNYWEQDPARSRSDWLEKMQVILQS